MTSTAVIEASRGSVRRTAKADDADWTRCHDTFGSEAEVSERIAAAMMLPELCKLTPNQLNDVKIVHDVWVMQGTLITNDGASKTQPRGILGSAADLEKAIGVKILSLAEAVAEIKRRIAHSPPPR